MLLSVCGLEYKGEELDTLKGRVLFVYTDGLNEAEDDQQNQFGDEHLLGILRQTESGSAHEIVETIANAVNQHRNGAEANDDLTMMCIRLC